MASLDKKELEQMHLDCFREAYGRFPEGKVESGEAPDFSILAPGRKLGIETTQLFRPVSSGSRPMQEQETLQQKVVDSAKNIFEECRSAGLDVCVFFNTHVLLSKRGVGPLARKMATLVAENVPRPGAWNELDWRIGSHFPEEISLMRVWYPTFDPESFWSVSRWAFVAEIDPAEIQVILDRKNSRISDYREDSNEIWLLIVADGRNHSTSVKFLPTVATHRFRSMFDRTFVFRRLEKQIIQLKTDGL